MKIALLGLTMIALCGCARMFEPLAQSVAAGIAPNSAGGEIYSGAIGFDAWHKRWPKTVEELKAGVRLAGCEVQFIPNLSGLTLSEEASELNVSHISSSGSIVRLQFSRPGKEPNQPPPPASLTRRG